MFDNKRLSHLYFQRHAGTAQSGWRIVTLGLWELFLAVGSGIPGCTFVIDGFGKYVIIVSTAQYGENIPRELLLRNVMSWG